MLKSLDPATEGAFRLYISSLRTAHKTAERMVDQETQRLNAMVAYRDSIVPLLARTRRHVFQNSCLGGYSVEGWEDEQGRPLLGSEADSLVRGGLNELGSPPGATIRRFPNSGSSSQSVSGSRDSAELLEQDEEATNTFVDAAHGRALGRGRENQSARVPDQDEEETSINPNRPLIVLDGRVVLRTGRAPLSMLAPGNQLGSQILMEVDRERQEASTKKSGSSRKKSRSRSRTGREPAPEASSSHQDDPHGPNGFTAWGNLVMSNSQGHGESASSSQIPAGQEREGRKKTSRGLFGFGRNRRDSHNNDDAIVPSERPAPISRFSLTGRRNRSSVDVSSTGLSGSTIVLPAPGHRRNVPSISIQNEDGTAQQESQPERRTFFENASLNDILLYSTTGVATGSIAATSTSPPLTSSHPGFARSRVMSMDEYIGFETITDYSGLNGSAGENHDGIAPGSAPLIPSYEEHQHHQVVDPESMLMRMGSVSAYDAMFPSFAEQHENGQIQYQQLLPGQSPSPPPLSGVVTRTRSRSLSPNPGMESITSSVYGASTAGAAGSTTRLPYQQHHYSFSDQTPEGRLLSGDMPPPDYVLQPPEYSM